MHGRIEIWHRWGLQQLDFLLARGSLKLAWGLLLLQLFSENLNHGGFLVLPGSCTDWGFVASLGPCSSPTRRRF